MATGGEEDVFNLSMSGSETLPERFCQPCSGDDSQLTAVGLCVDCREYLCEECFRCHTRPSMMRHHVLERIIQETPTGQVKDKCSAKCQQHEDKTVKYFCPSHAYLGCSVCITLQHRGCTGVVYIEEVAKDIANNTEYRQFDNKVKAMAKTVEELVPDVKQNLERLENNCSKENKSIREFRQKINDALDKIEKDIMKQARKMKMAQSRRLNDIIETCNTCLAEIQTIAGRFESLQNKGKMCDMYVAMKKAESQIQTLDKKLCEANSNNKINLYKFRSNEDVLQKLQTTNGIGYLFQDWKTVQHVKDIHVMPNTTQTKWQQMKMQQQFEQQQYMGTNYYRNPNTNSVYTRSQIQEFVIMPSNKLVFTNNNNNNRTIHVIDTSSSEMVDQLNMSGCPWGVTKVKSDEVAVTIPAQNIITFVKTEPHLAVHRHIKTNYACYGIAYNEDQLLVAVTGSEAPYGEPYGEPNRECYGESYGELNREYYDVPVLYEELNIEDDGVQFTETVRSTPHILALNMNGEELRAIRFDNIHQQIFNKPCHITFSQSDLKLYVSDECTNSVICMKLDGSVIGVYKDEELQCPGQVAVDHNTGMVYICGEKSNNIHEVSSDFKKVKLLLTQKDKLKSPRSISFDDKLENMYVGVAEDCMKVFKITR